MQLSTHSIKLKCLLLPLRRITFQMGRNLYGSGVLPCSTPHDKLDPPSHTISFSSSEQKSGRLRRRTPWSPPDFCHKDQTPPPRDSGKRAQCHKGMSVPQCASSVAQGGWGINPTSAD